MKRSKATGIITEIQRMSLRDGPGVRTVVCFKGCPLRCEWCYNPECISSLPQELFCKEKSMKMNCGKFVTPEAVLKEIRGDVPYYGSQGGVTFAGGEPLAQPGFLAACVNYCKQEGIRSAIETSLIYYHPEILKDMQVVMADLKIWDDAEHRRWTGVSNQKIKAHFQALDTLGVPIIVRTPVIPQVNATVENIAAISEFAAGMKNVIQYELLPYRHMGDVKRVALGEKERPFTVPDATLMKELNQYAFKRT